MSKSKSILWISGLTLLLALLACNIGARPPAPKSKDVLPSATAGVSIEPSSTEAQAETQLPPTESLTPQPVTDTPSGPTLTPTPQNPLVTETAYCWSGPTSKTLTYELISSIQAGTRVQLLGRGIEDGWWVVRNPRYNDPCWIQQEYIQIDPGYDLSTLRTFAVPPTPTATP
jgi:hypothetical protein